MSFLDKIKDASDKASKAVVNQYHQQQQKATDRKEEKAQALALEEARHRKILRGELEPITISMNLQADEKAYLELTARRMASVDSVISETVGTSKKKHVVRRAVVGSLVGPVGTIVGGATAGSKQTSTTTQKTVSSTELIDSGQMILTNQRFIFVGNNNVISLPYSDIVATGFSGNTATIKYAGMLNGEHFEVFGPNAKDTQLYYNGITKPS
jgi:septum formation inhibitor MinC